MTAKVTSICIRGVYRGGGSSGANENPLTNLTRYYGMTQPICIPGSMEVHPLSQIPLHLGVKSTID